MKHLFPALDEYRGIMRKEDFSDFIINLIETFIDVTPQHITQLKNAFQEKDNDAFKRAAHSLKSSGRTFNLTEFTTLVAELETRGCLEDSIEIQELIRHCESEFEQAKIELQVIRTEL